MSQSSIFFDFIKIVLRGVGQIMLQNNAITGVLFLIGISLGSLEMGIAATIATLTGTLTAKFFKYNSEKISEGIYGFSAALVGVALILFFKSFILCWISIVIGSVLATVLQNMFIRIQFPAFTLPFVLVTWFFLAVSTYFPFLERSLIVSPTQTPLDFLSFPFKGYGQVIFQGGLVSGIIFFIAVFISSPLASLYGLLGSITAGVLATYFFVDTNQIASGLLSYNAVLCAIVFAGDKPKDGLWSFGAIVLSLFIGLFMSHYQLIQLTFPFVAASAILVILKNSSEKKSI
ncbi:MAG: urea transporter [Flavobacteriales bacterium]|nr:urea transporter [Flavobacteriales bacterium]